MSNHNACALIMNKRINPLPWGLIYQPYLVHKKNKAYRGTASGACANRRGTAVRIDSTEYDSVKRSLVGGDKAKVSVSQRKSQRKSAFSQ